MNVLVYIKHFSRDLILKEHLEKNIMEILDRNRFIENSQTKV